MKAAVVVPEAFVSQRPNFSKDQAQAAVLVAAIFQ